jgi:prepilin-type N-terminal cleavage/methylation domain-containing protein
MNSKLRRYVRSQDGFTLIEVIIASAITVIVMTGLTSVVLTSMRAFNTASSRVEASDQIRSFELRANDDFARGGMPAGSCPCTTTPIVLTGLQASNSAPPVPGPYTVTYTWDGSAFLDRYVGSSSTRLATNVTAFSWNQAGRSVVVSMTVTVKGYSESQTFRFYPRLNP